MDYDPNHSFGTHKIEVMFQKRLYRFAQNCFIQKGLEIMGDAKEGFKKLGIYSTDNPDPDFIIIQSDPSGPFYDTRWNLPINQGTVQDIAMIGVQDAIIVSEWEGKRYCVKGRSKRWIEDHAAKLDMTYNQLMKAADKWVEYGDHTVQYNSESWRDEFDADTFWPHYEKVTGKTVQEKNHFFSCSC